MNKTQRKRLCWNCEGSVSIAEETCPFCDVSVVPAFLEGSTIEEPSFAPPYSSRVEENTEIPKSPYDINLDDEIEPRNPEIEIPKKQVEEVEEPSIDEFKSVVFSVSLLLGGSVFFMFSLALALFSTNGILTLHWNGEIWFVYALLAVPMLLLGWRSLMKLDVN